jgi:tricorn protease
MFHQFTRPLSVFSAVLKRMKEAVSIQRLRGLRLASTAQMLAMIVLAGAIGTQSFYAKAQTPTLMRFPNTFGDKIVFEAHDNLWMGSLKGGVVAQLTHGLSHDLLPRFSPDGKWIAFTRINQGTEDVYVLPAEGGEPRRLTFRSSRAGGPGPTFSADDNLVVTWTLDSAAIIFLARRQAFNWSDLSLYSVPVTGGLPSLLPLHPAGWMSYEPNSHTVAFTRSFTSFQSRKRYQGGLATDLFTYDSDTKHLVQLTHWKGMDDLPMWAGHKIYFLSDRGPLHRANIWVHDLQTNTEHQVTHFADYDVDMPSLGRGSLSFQQGGSLFTLSLPEETLHRIQLTVPDDGAQTGDRVVRTEPMFQDTDHGGTNFTVSSKGDFAVLSARGDLFRLSGGGSSAVNLTGTSDVSEDHPVISPDGVLVAYLTDRSGEQQVALLPAGGGREQILSHYRNGFTPRRGPLTAKHYWLPTLKISCCGCLSMGPRPGPLQKTVMVPSSMERSHQIQTPLRTAPQAQQGSTVFTSTTLRRPKSIIWPHLRAVTTIPSFRPMGMHSSFFPIATPWYFGRTLRPILPLSNPLAFMSPRFFVMRPFR